MKYISVAEFKEFLYDLYQKRYQDGLLQSDETLSGYETIEFIEQALSDYIKGASIERQNKIKSYAEQQVVKLASGELTGDKFYASLEKDMAKTTHFAKRIFDVFNDYSLYASLKENHTGLFSVKVNTMHLLVQEAIERIQKHELNINATVGGVSILNKVILEGTDPALFYSIMNMDVNLDMYDRTGKKPLAHLIDGMKKIATPACFIETMIDHGMDLSNVDTQGTNALTYAVLENCFQAVKVMLEKGVPVEGKTKDWFDLLEKSAEAGFDYLPEKVDIFSYAMMMGDTKMFSYLLQYGKVDMNGADELGNTALIYASTHKDYLNGLRQLLMQGADVNKQNNKGQTPLMVAVQTQNKTAFQLLLQTERVDIAKKDVNGLTVVDYVNKYTQGKLREKMRKYIEEYSYFMSRRQKQAPVLIQKATTSQVVEDNQNIKN